MRKYLRISKKKKQLAKLADFRSDANWTLAEAIDLLLSEGYAHTHGEGSHRVFVHPDKDAAIVLAAHGKKIKTGYIREIRKAIIS